MQNLNNFLNHNVANILVTVLPIYNVTNAEMKLVANCEIDAYSNSHCKRKCLLDFNVGMQISSNNPSSWLSSEDKVDASFTQSDGTAVLNMMSCLEFFPFVCEYEL